MVVWFAEPLLATSINPAKLVETAAVPLLFKYHNGPDVD